MVNHPNRSRRKTVSLILSPSDVRALENVHSHLTAIAADYPANGAGNGYGEEAVKHMHRGVEIVADLLRQCSAPT